MDFLSESTRLFWIAAGVVFLFFGTPLWVLKSFRAEAHPTVEPLSSNTPLPGSVEELIDSLETELKPRGFTSEGSFFLPRQTHNVRTLLTLLVNRATQEGVMGVVMYARINDGWRQSHFIEFFTRYANGQEIDTINSPLVPAFPGRPHTLSVYVPWITDVGELYRVHQSLAAAKGPPGAKALKLDAVYHGDPIAYVAGVLRDSYESAVQRGYLRLTSDGSHYRPTFIGAYRMAWKLLQPMKSIIVIYRRHHVQRILAELDIRN